MAEQAGGSEQGNAKSLGADPSQRLAEVRARVGESPVALVLGGGGTLGSFETGVLRFLYDHLGLAPAVICGTSVGSLLSAKLAEGDDPAGGERAVDGLERVWRGLRGNHDMWLAEPWFESLLAQGPWASELRRHVPSGNGPHLHLLLHVIDTIVRHGQDVRNTVDALTQAMSATSLLNLHPVKALLARELDSGRVAASGIRLRMATVSLESGDLRYVTESGALVDRDGAPLDLEPVPLVDAVVASCSIPLVFPPVPLGSEHYVDGGTREVLPIPMAAACLGAGSTFVVAAFPPGLAPVDSFADKGLLDVWRRTTGTIGPDESLYKAVHPPGGWGPDVTIVVPQLRVHHPLVVDPELIAISIDYGFMRAADVVLGAGDEDCAVTADLTRVRMALRENTGGPVSGPFGPAPAADAVGQPSPSQGELQERLRALVLRRRERGLPLPTR